MFAPPIDEDLTATDGFCGAGGSSEGLESVPGVRVVMAANHDPLAVATHNHNLPHADHECADLSQVDFRRYPATDLLWMSPDCTDHSQAKKTELKKGEKAQRSRATMFDVARALDVGTRRRKPYLAFFVENVVEVHKWVFFPMWQEMLRAAEYCIHEVSFNSAHAQAGGLPAPQSRDRWYCVGHLKKIPCPDLDKWMRPQAHCPKCDVSVSAIQVWKNPAKPWGKYRQQYLWRCPACATAVEPAVLPAAYAINGDDPGTRIGDRGDELAEKTMGRINAGIDKWERGLFDAPALIVPVEGRDGKRAMDAAAPFRTFTTRAETSLLFAPFITEMRGGGSLKSARTVLEPLGTVTSGGNHHGLVIPPGFMMRNNGSTGAGGEHCTSLLDMMRTLTTKGHQSVVTWLQANAGRIRAEDCSFRMLQPSEQMAAMAFSDKFEMIPGTSKRNMTRLAGQAVTPPVARDLASAMVEAIRGEELEPRGRVSTAATTVSLAELLQTTEPIQKSA
jgi:DNA (cytosine-5)-methyltransferase 1